VVWLDEMSLYGMAAAIGPDKVGLWLSSRPEGPWSAPAQLPFPHCGDSNPVGLRCYHGTIHQALSGKDYVAIGFHDANQQRAHGRAATNRVSIVPVDLTPAPAGTCRTPFRDVRSAHPFCPQIGWLATSGITGGYPDGTFRPTDAVQRQAMAAFLYRSAGNPNGSKPACTGATPPFTDVPLDHPFCGEIQWLAGTGITKGYPDETFKPTSTVQRQAMAAFLYRFAGNPNGVKPACTGVTPPFTDVPLDHPFCGEIQWLAGTGITKGYPDGSFRGGSTVQRMAMAAFLQRYDTR